MLELLYDPEDEFFYDVDRHGQKRKFLSISISNVFQEHVLDQDMADRIYQRHMKNPHEFWTEYPFPSMAICDPGSKKGPGRQFLGLLFPGPHRPALRQVDGPLRLRRGL